MADLIDADALREYLDETIRSYSALASEQEDSSVQARVDGALVGLRQVQREVTSGRFTPAKKPLSEAASRPAVVKVRAYDPQTSWEAATALTPEKSRELYLHILYVLSLGPKTDEEIQDALAGRVQVFTFSGARSRRHELVEAGWVKDTGVRRPTHSGHPSTVWGLVG